MDTFYTFLVFAVVLVFEQFASQMWLGLYYRFGLPVFFTQKQMGQKRPIGELPQALEQAFKGRAEHPTIRFRALSEHLIAIRETLFENRGGFRYFPIMHSALRVQPGQRSMQVIGYLNWYVLVALVYLVYRAWIDRGFIPVAVLILFVLAVSYAAQAGINRKIAEEAAERQSNG